MSKCQKCLKVVFFRFLTFWPKVVLWPGLCIQMKPGEPAQAAVAGPVYPMSDSGSRWGYPGMGWYGHWCTTVVWVRVQCLAVFSSVWLCFPVFGCVFQCWTVFSSVGPCFPVLDQFWPILTDFDEFWPILTNFDLYRTRLWRKWHFPWGFDRGFRQKFTKKCHFSWKSVISKCQVSRWHFSRFWRFSCFLVFSRIRTVLTRSMRFGKGFGHGKSSFDQWCPVVSKCGQNVSKMAKNGKNGILSKNYGV